MTAIRASDAKVGCGAIRRVLIVDDSRLQRRILASHLEKWGLEVAEADSGEMAMQVCTDWAPDLVISDWMMPGMNGLDLCRQFRKLPTFGYFILLTSKSEKEEVAEGLNAGADDFLTKPVNAGELRARISAGARILSMHRELSQKNALLTEALRKLQSFYDSIDRDLIQAKTIQESLVPERTRAFGRSRVDLLLKPCGHIGGDLVGMFSPDDEQVGFFSIDVSGHGITSAMMTARLGSYLSSSFFDQNVAMEKRPDGSFTLRPPHDVAAQLNARIAADKGIEEYFTMVYATVELATGRVRMVRAGHPHPLLLRADGTAEFVGEGCLPIGLMPEARYISNEFELTAGDRLLVFSDGFPECRVMGGRYLEDFGLLELVRACEGVRPGRAFLDELYGGLFKIMDNEDGLEDDVSAVLFEFYDG
ncbi:PP2C family protein-serine/threonine phosphatase [Chachezhania sediminis]|uniref:PP2C family protein-serine/threonine phosphatase n=1 Tax=Chachezhania sediminis TaxID=2599291 RepID=UPI001E5CA8C4|nr:SpoIIE family protein phosphatase [Chachezhania sediminis]